MQEKIGVITTGGTIGSILSGNAMSVDPKGDVIRREIEQLCDEQGFKIELKAALNKNSEDFTPVDWGTLIDAVNAFISEGVRRIVITHGTDTMAYTAAALGLAFQNSGVRLCLTGSFYALDAPNSDGPLNLHAAFQAVTNDCVAPGVYVAFRRDQQNQHADIYDALNVKPMAFDAFRFSSVHDHVAATYSRTEGVKAAGPKSKLATPEVGDLNTQPERLAVAARQVMYVEHYPGIAFDRIDHTRLSFLLVGLYHSGTALAQTGQGSLLSLIHSKDETVQVLAASYPDEVVPIPYASTVRLSEAGVGIVKKLPVHVIYVFVVLKLASGASNDQIVASLAPWILECSSTQ